MKSFLKNNWVKILGIAVGACAVIPALAPVALPLVGVGGLILGADFQFGTKLGTPIGSGAKEIAERLKKSAP